MIAEEPETADISFEYPSVGRFFPNAFVLHLDIWVWVRLSQGVSARSGVFWELYEALREARDNGHLNVALSGHNYLELWNRRDKESRDRLGRVMADVSGYVTLRSVDDVRWEEVRRAVDGISAGRRAMPIDRGEILGVGVKHAFASEMGRIRWIESLAEAGGEEGVPSVVPTVWSDFARTGPAHVWEWLNLVGFDQDYSIPGIDYRPEHRLGDEWAGIRNEMQRLLDAEVADESLVYRKLIGRALGSMGESIAEAFGSDEAILRHFRCPTDGAAFIGNMPTEHVGVELQFRAMKNKQYVFKQHDRSDVFDLSLALPYCDAVWADAHWSHIARASKLPELYGTRVLNKPGELLALIAGLDGGQSLAG